MTAKVYEANLDGLFYVQIGLHTYKRLQEYEPGKIGRSMWGAHKYACWRNSLRHPNE